MSNDDVDRLPRQHTGHRSVSVLIVTWRTRELARQAVQHAVDALRGYDLEVIVVDNASGDGTAAAIREISFDGAEVVVIDNTDNLGYAGGNNQAFAASRGDDVIVLNPDVLLTRAAAEAVLEEVANNDGVGLVSTCLVGPDRRAQTLHRRLPTAGMFLWTATRWGAWLDHRVFGRRAHRRLKLLDRPRLGVDDVEQVAGAFFACRRELITGALDGVFFDRDLPILFNDVDLSKRVLGSGRVNRVLWSHTVEHIGGASLRQVPRSELDRERRNGWSCYATKHGPLALRLAVGITHIATSLPGPRVDRALDGGAERPSELATPVPFAHPLVSIVIPSYNYGRFIGEAIEIIVVDDGSTDDTDRVLDRYRGQIIVIRQPNRGLSATRNRGIDAATGDFIAFLDADDHLHPLFVERCLEQLEQHPTAGFAYPQLELFEASTATTAFTTVTRTEPYDLDRLVTGNEIHACSLIRSHLCRTHRFDERNRRGWEDWDYWLTLAEHGWGGVLVDEVLVNYRRHDASMTAEINARRKRWLKFRVLRRHGHLVGWGAVMSSLVSACRLEIGLLRRRVRVRFVR